VKTGVQEVLKGLKILDSGACPGPDPGFAGMTEEGRKPIFSQLRGGGNNDSRKSVKKEVMSYELIEPVRRRIIVRKVNQHLLSRPQWPLKGDSNERKY
jgi:hypothetical protein